jgi:uncharacterized protein YcnI
MTSPAVLAALRLVVRGAVGAGVPVAVLAVLPSASAHVTITPSTTSAGEHAVAVVALGHGCEHSPTTRVAIRIPEQLLSVTPARNPFWDVRIVREELAEPKVEPHGNEVTERVAEVVYTAEEPLPDGVRDTFELSFAVPDLPGETLVFPAIQTCVDGETAWTEVAPAGTDPDDLEHPAPAFTVTRAPGMGDGPDEDGADDESPAATSSVGVVGAGAGVLGMVTGGIALARARRRN